MDLASPPLFSALFQLGVTVVSVAAACLGGLFYFRRVRQERPAIGKFNGRDVMILFGFLVLLPVFYLVLPEWALTTVLVLSFTAALYIGFHTLLSPTPLWLGIGVLIGANLWMGQRMINGVVNWQVVWAQNSIVVLLAVIGVANLYVQGGMELRHLTWFAGGLAVYDSLFTLMFPVSNLLIRAFVNHPLFPAMGMRIYYDEAIIGLGDLLVYTGFTIAAYKAYGRPGLRLALPLVLVFGAILPPLSGLFINYVDSRLDVVIPAQTWFGPAAVAGYLWLRRRYGRERTMKEYLASVDAGRRAPAATPVLPGRPAIEPEPVVLSKEGS
jgi:hypothetical protein